MAVPLITTPSPETGKCENLIGLAATGSGKTAAFGVGSLMRIDRAN